MIAACDGSSHEDHTSTANAWTNHLVVPKKIVYPFDLFLPTLIKKEYEAEIDVLREGKKNSFNGVSLLFKTS